MTKLTKFGVNGKPPEARNLATRDEACKRQVKLTVT